MSEGSHDPRHRADEAGDVERMIDGLFGDKASADAGTEADQASASSASKQPPQTPAADSTPPQPRPNKTPAGPEGALQTWEKLINATVQQDQQFHNRAPVPRPAPATQPVQTRRRADTKEFFQLEAETSTLSTAAFEKVSPAAFETLSEVSETGVRNPFMTGPQTSVTLIFEAEQPWSPPDDEQDDDDLIEAMGFAFAPEEGPIPDLPAAALQDTRTFKTPTQTSRKSRRFVTPDDQPEPDSADWLPVGDPPLPRQQWQEEALPEALPVAEAADGWEDEWTDDDRPEEPPADDDDWTDVDAAAPGTQMTPGAQDDEWEDVDEPAPTDAHAAPVSEDEDDDWIDPEPPGGGSTAPESDEANGLAEQDEDDWQDVLLAKLMPEETAALHGGDAPFLSETAAVEAMLARMDQADAQDSAEDASVTAAEVSPQSAAHPAAVDTPSPLEDLERDLHFMPPALAVPRVALREPVPADSAVFRAVDPEEQKRRSSVASALHERIEQARASVITSAVRPSTVPPGVQEPSQTGKDGTRVAAAPVDAPVHLWRHAVLSAVAAALAFFAAGLIGLASVLMVSLLLILRDAPWPRLATAQGAVMASIAAAQCVAAPPF